MEIDFLDVTKYVQYKIEIYFLRQECVDLFYVKWNLDEEYVP